MGSPEILTIILAVIAATGASLMTGLMTRPKMTAEARAATASGEVALSSDARAWAETFRKQAEEAAVRAIAAAARADIAEEKADRAEARLSSVERRLNALVDYVATLQSQIRLLGGHPVDQPPHPQQPL